MLTFDAILDALIRERDYRKSLEDRLKRTEEQRDGYRDVADPGWRERELREALDGEIRLMRQ